MRYEEINKLIDDFLREKTMQVDEKTWKCKRCGAIIQGEGKRLSVHDAYSLFGGKHAGGGEVREIVFPYCTNCDGESGRYFDAISCIDF